MCGWPLGMTMKLPATNVSRVRSWPGTWKTGPVSTSNLPDKTTHSTEAFACVSRVLDFPRDSLGGLDAPQNWRGGGAAALRGITGDRGTRRARARALG